MQTQLKQLSNSELLDKTKQLAFEERKLNIEILKHLKEIESRRLFLEIGYRSLFEYAVKELSYSEDAAYRRINAMRLLKDLPQVEEKIQSGSLSLTAACKVQNFFKAQSLQQKEDLKTKAAHDLQRNIIPTNTYHSQIDKLKLIESLENKSTREIEKELLKLNPELIPQEKVRPITENKTEIKLVIDDELKSKLDQLKNLLSHTNPNMSYKELIACLAEMGLEKLDPARKSARKNRLQERRDLSRKNASSKRVSNLQRNVSGAQRVNSRYISPAIKQEVWLRDQGRCTYIYSTGIDKNSGRRCSSNHLLQYDHIEAFRNGGESSVRNLRLLCQQHNLHRD